MKLKIIVLLMGAFAFNANAELKTLKVVAQSCEDLSKEINIADILPYVLINEMKVCTSRTILRTLNVPYGFADSSNRYLESYHDVIMCRDGNTTKLFNGMAKFMTQANGECAIGYVVARNDNAPIQPTAGQAK